MNDVRTQLERARREAPEVSADPARLHERREAKARMKRITTIVAASVIGLLPIALGLAIIGGHEGSSARSGSVIGPPTTDLRLAPGEYYYQRFDAGYGVCESWWALDDSGKLATVRPENGGCWGPKDGTYGPGGFYSDSGPVRNLSTDPAELEQQLRDRVQPGGASPEPYDDWGGPIEWGLIRSIGELLEAPDVDPAQKAALMQVAASLDGVEVDLHSSDPAGRAAILLTLDSEHAIHEWWFDPESHQLMAIGGDDPFPMIVQAAGIAGSKDSTDLDRSFFRQVQS